MFHQHIPTAIHRSEWTSPGCRLNSAVRGYLQQAHPSHPSQSRFASYLPAERFKSVLGRAPRYSLHDPPWYRSQLNSIASHVLVSDMIH